jgi:hypothetical protein
MVRAAFVAGSAGGVAALAPAAATPGGVTADRGVERLGGVTLKPTAGQPAPRRPDSGDNGPVEFTAYQRNADGDDATLQSREGELSDDERRKVEKLQRRDAQVKRHEQAHVAAAGALFRGGPYYSYQTGPDGKRYAVGGSVNIDTSAVPGDPEATMRKAQQIKAAALAPADPSSTDRAVAAKASRMKAEAQRELAEQRMREQRGRGGDAKSAAARDAGEYVVMRPDVGGPTNDPAAGARADGGRDRSNAPRVEAGAPGAEANGPSIVDQARPGRRYQFSIESLGGGLSGPAAALNTDPTEALASTPTEALATSPTAALASPARVGVRVDVRG